ncbi:MAG TPA: 3'-5' exonuclease [Salinivirgaceae bacterium]|nr:3'-5' exonuclease [Salinivirgaceae bacterium]
MTEKPLSQEEILQLPLQYFEGQILLIDSIPDLKNVIQSLQCSSVLGFDTETKPSFRKGHTNSVALVQLCDGKTAFLIRLHHREFVQQLRTIFENPSIIKAGVAIHDDLKGLKKLYNFVPNGFVELQTMAKEMGYSEISLKKMTARFLHFRISKNQQTSNWNSQNLTHAQQIYAATDAWVSYLIYNKLTELKKQNQK